MFSNFLCSTDWSSLIQLRNYRDSSHLPLVNIRSPRQHLKFAIFVTGFYGFSAIKCESERFLQWQPRSSSNLWQRSLQSFLSGKNWDGNGPPCISQLPPLRPVGSPAHATDSEFDAAWKYWWTHAVLMLQGSSPACISDSLGLRCIRNQYADTKGSSDVAMFTTDHHCCLIAGRAKNVQCSCQFLN